MAGKAGNQGELVRLLYESVEEPQCWTQALMALAAHVNADHILLDVKKSQSMCPEPVMSAHVEEGHVRAYVSHPEYPLFRGLAANGPRGVAFSDEAVFDAKLRACSSLYQDVIRPMNGHHAMLALPACGSASASQPILVACRPAHRSPFTTRELTKLQRVLPHIQTALRLRERIVRSDAELQWRNRMLDALPFGLFVLNALERLVYVNPAALAAIQRSNGLRLSASGCLSLATQQGARNLHKVIKEALNSPGEAGSTVRVPGCNGVGDLWLRVLPVPADGDVASQLPDARVIVFCDSIEHHIPDIQKLSAFFELTRREAELAILLAKGTELASAAAKLGVTVETARSHLKGLFSKTDTHRQAELIQILTSFSSWS